MLHIALGTVQQLFMGSWKTLAVSECPAESQALKVIAQTSQVPKGGGDPAGGGDLMDTVHVQQCCVYCISPLSCWDGTLLLSCWDGTLLHASCATVLE